MKQPCRIFFSLFKSAVFCVCAACFALCVTIVNAADAEPLPGTQPLTMEGDLSSQMISRIDTYLLREIGKSVETRQKYWHRDLSSREAYEKSVEPNREHFRHYTGVVDARLTFSDLEYNGGVSSPVAIAETRQYAIFAVRWPVLEGVSGQGLLLKPKGAIKARVVALPDADQTPEMLAGLAPGISAEAQFARRLVENGVEVVIPLLINRNDEFSGNATLGKFTNQPHREWIYRQAFQMGRHIIGYEVQKVLAVVDWFAQQDKGMAKPLKIGVAGYGEGGLLAFYSAAMDTRIDACLVSGYFGPREAVWEEPIYRNVFGLLHEFGDAEIASLIAPRSLTVEYAQVPKVDGPPKSRPGRTGAAPGKLVTPAYDAVEKEFNRIDALTRPSFQPKSLVKAEGVEFGSAAALKVFGKSLGIDASMSVSAALLKDSRKDLNIVERQREQVKELEMHVQRLVRDSDNVRDTFFLKSIPVIREIEKSRHFTMHKMDTRPVESFTKENGKFRQYFWEEVIGKLDDPSLPPNAHTRKIYDNPKWTGYDVVLDVWPGVYAWGVLLVPKDIKPGERRPVVVCQHGRNGLPKDTIEGNVEAYNNFAAQLAEQGFITFAPHNLYRGEDAYRWIGRKANNIKASMFSVIIAHHQQFLNWLETLPFVDARRMAFYGLSYGGETAVRVPAVLEKYCLSICSGDFNDWTRKVASTDSPYSFMFSVEWEMPYFNMGETFSYAEMTYVIFPRPFMVERGHHDGVAPDQWVAYEYAKTRYLYDQFAQGDKTEIEFFNGGHTIHGEGTFRFLHKQLDWPER